MTWIWRERLKCCATEEENQTKTGVEDIYRTANTGHVGKMINKEVVGVWKQNLFDTNCLICEKRMKRSVWELVSAGWFFFGQNKEPAVTDTFRADLQINAWKNTPESDWKCFNQDFIIIHSLWLDSNWACSIFNFKASCPHWNVRVDVLLLVCKTFCPLQLKCHINFLQATFLFLFSFLLHMCIKRARSF